MKIKDFGNCIFLCLCYLFLGYILAELNQPITEEVPIEKDIPTTISTSDMIRYLNPKVDKSVASIISKSIDKHNNLPRELLVGLIFRESSFNPLSVSKSGCIGLMQINPKAHPKKVKGYTRGELFHIDTNINIGCAILEGYYKKDKSIKIALIKYLGANNKKYREGILYNFTNLVMLNIGCQ